MDEIELKARELLASEFRKIGNYHAAHDAQNGFYQPEVAAVVAALVWRYENGGVLQWDDASVDAFAMTMKAKMAASRAKGRGGWEDPEQCSADDLSRMLREHVDKGDPVDVANFCMMLGQRGESIASLPQWQVIEFNEDGEPTNVPADTPILVPPTKRLGMTVAKWNPLDGWETETTSEWVGMYRPTHFQPLPAPPEIPND